MGNSPDLAFNCAAGATASLSLHHELAGVYRRLWPIVYARCRRILRCRHQAEDAAQEVFLKILDHPAPVVDDEAAVRWLLRVTTNHCFNRLRDDKRRALEGALGGAGGADFCDGVAEREWLRKLIAAMPRDVGLVGWLNHVDELDQADIALQLGISRRTVVARLSTFKLRAKRAIANL